MTSTEHPDGSHETVYVMQGGGGMARALLGVKQEEVA